jgi:hypothetical protein
MIEQDTVKLLRECDAGIRMGVASIDDVMPHVESTELKGLLDKCRQEHKQLEHAIRQQLNCYGDEGKAPNPIVKGMSKLKTELKLGLSEKDSTVACLMTDGCNMGVKSLNKYLNRYTAASEHSKDICKRLINQEEQLAIDLRSYL